ncbi:MAG: substrate-binding domain-containing protein, partial [Ginsengibacter sp.]
MNPKKNKYNISFAAAVITLFMAFTFAGCHGGNERTDLDTPEKGTIYISVDESFKPIIDSEIMVYEALNPQAKIIAEYKSEAECFKDLIKDSTRMIIVTRALSEIEEKYYKDTLSFDLIWTKIAYDAVAVIVNNKAKDSLFSMSQLRGILDGTTGDQQLAVFD